MRWLGPADPNARHPSDLHSGFSFEYYPGAPGFGIQGRAVAVMRDPKPPDALTYQPIISHVQAKLRNFTLLRRVIIFYTVCEA